MILNTKTPMHNLVNTILRQRWVWIIIPGLLLGCDLINRNNESTVNDWDGVAVPLAIINSNLPGNTYARLYMDEGATPLREQIVTTDGSQATVTFANVEVPAGSHSFTIRFENQSSSFGLVELARAQSPAVDLAPSSTSDLSEFFINDNYYFTDTDSDHVTNLDELIAGSPPDDDVCVVGVSKIGFCSLGT